MAYRNKTYIAFDGDNDMNCYRLMTAWTANDRFEFEFNNAHDLNTARDSSQEESIKAQLRLRLANSKIFILLIGKNTRFLTKFVKWEIETAVRLKLPIIAINLNGSRKMDDLVPPAHQTEETTTAYYEIAIREKHSDQCGGDPMTEPAVDRFRIHRKAHRVEWLEPVEARWQKYKPGSLK